MVDLSTVLNCVKEMRVCGIYRGQKVGMVRKNFCGYHVGRVVLYTSELTPSDSELQMGEYRGMQQKPTGRITVEIPLNPEQISRNKERGSLIRTMGTMINVPSKNVEEIRV